MLISPSRQLKKYRLKKSNGNRWKSVDGEAGESVGGRRKRWRNKRRNKRRKKRRKRRRGGGWAVFTAN